MRGVNYEMSRTYLGQGKLAFTKQMLRVFHLIDLEELDLLVADSSKLGNRSLYS
jgi:hypothetical protein